jgi:hypothetical protein
MDPADAPHDSGPLALLKPGPANDAPALGAVLPPPTDLLDQLRTEIRTRHDSLRAKDAYVDWVRRFILSHGKRQVSASTQNRTEVVLVFLYSTLLKQDLPWINQMISVRVHKTPARGFDVHGRVRTARCNEKGGQQIAGRLVVCYWQMNMRPGKGRKARADGFSDRRRTWSAARPLAPFNPAPSLPPAAASPPTCGSRR